LACPCERAGRRPREFAGSAINASSREPDLRVILSNNAIIDHAIGEAILQKHIQLLTVMLAIAA
jgi:hypothetical protein